jgi:predicted methyltransferase
MHRIGVLLSALALCACATASQRPATFDQVAIDRAVADPNRPEAQRARDTLRKPAELMALAEIRPGLKMAEFLPVGAAGIGYFTRMFSVAIGPGGRIYGHVPTEQLALSPRDVNSARTLEGDANLPNLTLLRQPLLQFAVPEPLDLYWTSLNYHDVPLELGTEPDLEKFNRAVFKSLRPGGIYIVIDHSAEPGSGLRALRLHRIDPELVKRQVVGVGFVLDGESNILANPADDHTLSVFDASVRGRTDQFVLRFRKPG